jgi:hypothetical protein
MGLAAVLPFSRREKVSPKATDEGLRAEAIWRELASVGSPSPARSAGTLSLRERVESAAVRGGRIDALEGDKFFLARFESGANFFHDPNRHPILGLFIAEAREQRIVVAAAEDDEFLAGLCSEKLRFHGDNLPVGSCS